MQVPIEINGRPCCLLALYATTRERKEVQGDTWYHYPFIELRTLEVSEEESTGKLSSKIVVRLYFEPKEAVGYENLNEALAAARTWVTANKSAMGATLQEDYGNGLP